MFKHQSCRYAAIALFAACTLVVAGNPADAADLNKLLDGCADCHEKDGNSKNVDTPSIAGMSPAYFKESMKAYSSNTRPALKLKDKKKSMKDVVKDLSDADITALATHYSKQPFKAYKQSFDAAKAKAGKGLHIKYCDKCHSEGGTSAEDDAGILAGQPSGYLRYSLKNYADGKRDMGKKMAKKFNTMYKKDGDAALDQLINYYASQQ